MSDRIRNDTVELATDVEPAPKPAPDRPAAPDRPPPVEPRRQPETVPETAPKLAPETVPEIAPETADGDADTEPEADAEPKDTADDSARKTQARITRLNREKWEARRDAAAAQARLDELQRAYQQQQSPQPGQPPQEAVAEARRQLQAEQQMREFNERCNATFAKGAGEYGDAEFRDAVGALNAVGAGGRADFLDAITQIPDGHRLYPLLAADLDNAGRILSLTPLRMAVELAKLAMAAQAPDRPAAPESNGANGAAAEPPPVTRAPPPIRPIRGGTARTPGGPNESMAEFIRRRDREESEKRRI